MEEERKSIYYLFFEASGKGYVGQTKNFERRMKEHQHENSGCRYLKHAIQFYGFDECGVYILEDDLSIDEANELETVYIRELGTLVPNGYNLNEGGNCAPMLQETKDLLAEMAKNRWADPEFREKQLALMRSDEYREKHRVNSTKLWQDEEFRKKMSEKMKEKYQLPEYCQQMSDIMKELWQNQEYRDKVSVGVAKYWERLEHVEAARERAKKLWEDEEFRRKAVEGTRAACNTAEMKELRSKNAIEKWADEDFRAKQMVTRSSEEFKEKMSASLNTEEHKNRKARIREEKSRLCREVFVRLGGDRQKVAEELGISVYTVAEYMKPYKNDEEIIGVKKKHFKDAHNTPENKEKKRLARLATVNSKSV